MTSKDANALSKIELQLRDIEIDFDSLKKLFGPKTISPITCKSNKILAEIYYSDTLRPMLKFVKHYYGILSRRNLDSNHKVMRLLIKLNSELPNLVDKYRDRIDASEY